MMDELIESLAVKGSASGCPELVTLGRTLKKRMSGIALGLHNLSN